MIKNLKGNKILWLLIALMALIASLVGVAQQDIYQKFRVGDALPAILSQDIIAVLVSIASLFLIIKIKEGDFVKQLIMLGIIGYLFYIYGLYTVGKIYNVLYFLYMAIFSLSFFTLIYGIANIRNESYEKIKIPGIVRKVSAAFLFLIPVMLYPMWIIQMLPFIQEMRVPVGGNFYILDMCFFFPVCAIMAVMLLKKNKFAILLTPVILIKGFALGFSVTLTEFLKPFYNLTCIMPYALLFVFFTLASLVLAVLYFKKGRYFSNY